MPSCHDIAVDALRQRMRPHAQEPTATTLTNDNDEGGRNDQKRRLLYGK